VQLGSANSLSNVSWANGSKFMQVEVDFGSGFVDIGTQQMLSVPYALFSGQAENSNFLLDEYISVWNDNATINLLPNKKYFINSLFQLLLHSHLFFSNITIQLNVIKYKTMFIK
jgi:hypothetical protein